MYIQYDGGIEDDITTEIVEKVLEGYGIQQNKKEISWDIF
jgi:hypothetical protein